MALDDLLAAITQETDQRIAQAKEAHRTQVSTLREESEHRLQQKKQELAGQRKEKEQQMRAKAQTHMALQRRNSLLRTKQDLLEQFYGDVIDIMAKEKPAAIEKFLTTCLEQIKEKGEIRPAKGHEALLKKIADAKRFTIGKPVDALGGFLFISDSQERDYTFEHLVREQLRPKTEVDVASTLFGS